MPWPSTTKYLGKQNERWASKFNCTVAFQAFVSALIHSRRFDAGTLAKKMSVPISRDAVEQLMKPLQRDGYITTAGAVNKKNKLPKYEKAKKFANWLEQYAEFWFRHLRRMERAWEARTVSE